MTSEERTLKQEHASIYQRLGVEPIVNCGSSRSVYGNSTMSDPVREAMESCSAPGSLDTSLSHAAGLSDIAACHA